MRKFFIKLLFALCILIGMFSLTLLVSAEDTVTVYAGVLGADGSFTKSENFSCYPENTYTSWGDRSKGWVFTNISPEEEKCSLYTQMKNASFSMTVPAEELVAGTYKVLYYDYAQASNGATTAAMTLTVKQAGTVVAEFDKPARTAKEGACWTECGEINVTDTDDVTVESTNINGAANFRATAVRFVLIERAEAEETEVEGTVAVYAGTVDESGSFTKSENFNCYPEKYTDWAGRQNGWVWTTVSPDTEHATLYTFMKNASFQFTVSGSELKAGTYKVLYYDYSQASNDATTAAMVITVKEAGFAVGVLNKPAHASSEPSCWTDCGEITLNGTGDVTVESINTEGAANYRATAVKLVPVDVYEPTVSEAPENPEGAQINGFVYDGDWKANDEFKGPIDDITMWIDRASILSSEEPYNSVNENYCLYNPNITDQSVKIWVWLISWSFGQPNKVTYEVKNGDTVTSFDFDMTSVTESGWYQLGTEAFEFGSDPAENYVRLVCTDADNCGDNTTFRASTVRFEIQGELNEDGFLPGGYSPWKYVSPDPESKAAERKALMDIPEDSPIRYDIEYMFYEGFVYCTDVYNYEPDKNITKDDFVSYTGNVLEAYNVAYTAAELTEGIDDDAALTKEEIAIILYNAKNLLNKHTEWLSSIAVDYSAIKDANDISENALDAVDLMYRTGIFALDQEGKLNPGATVSRGEATVMLKAFTQLFVQSSPVTEDVEADDWVMTFNDEFQGTSLDTRVWVPSDHNPGHIQCSRHPENLEVHDGALHLVTKKESRVEGKNWTTGDVRVKKGFAQEYGYWECRYKYCNATGINNSFWMCYDHPTDGDYSYEIDVNEGHFPNEVNPTYHNYTDGKHRNPHTTVVSDYNLASDYHTYAVKWDPDYIYYYFDGVEVFKTEWITEPGYFCGPILGTAVLRSTGAITDEADGTEMVVDYVRVWQRSAYLDEHTSITDDAALDGDGTAYSLREYLSFGAGSETDSYEIATAEDLCTVALLIDSNAIYADGYYVLTEDIDLAGADFDGIGKVNAFRGTFDGNGHVIRNISIDCGDTAVGLFRQTNGATIKNVGVEGGNISGAERVGGIVGYAENTTIQNCWNSAAVKGYNNVGGIIGVMRNSNLFNSFNKGEVRISMESVGGLVGSTYDDTAAEASLLRNCYNIGKVYSGTNIGQLVGYADKTIRFENVYYNTEAPNQDTPIGNRISFAGIIGKTKASLTAESFVATLNANLEEGDMSWTYGADGIARLADFGGATSLEIFMASVDSVTVADGKVQETVSADGAYKTMVYGSDHKSVIDLEGNVYEPLTEKTVLLILNVVDTATGEVVGQIDRNIAVTVSGKYENTGIGEIPNVVPGLREWYGLGGTFTVTKDTRIVYTDEVMAKTAEQIGEFLAEILGYTLEITSSSGSAGDIILQYTKERAAELGEEGYATEITDRVVISADTTVGMLYGGVTVAQILEQYDSIPTGYIRDYPQYEMRGGMIDVARRYYSLDYIEEIGKYMSYYKLNTFHLHINDNFGEERCTFRVESKKYPALNSSNAGYTWSQDDYRQMQKNLKEYGVNVITEIDSPGHAIAFGLVDSNLVNGKCLNLVEKYDECLALVESIFDEFLDGEDPVFQNAIVHIGTDEAKQNTTNELMRMWIRDLSQYMLAKDNIEKVAFWGNLSLYYGETEIPTENVIAHHWDSPDYRADAILADGFEVINSTSNMLYLVPSNSTDFAYGTYMNGYVDLASFYEVWGGGSDFTTHNLKPTQSNYNGTLYAEHHDILKGNPKILGALFCSWEGANSGHDYDILNLLVPYIAGTAEKLWYGDTNRFDSGDEFVEAFNAVGGSAPYANPRYYVESDGKEIASYGFEQMTDGIVADSVNGYDAVVTGGEIAVDGKHGNVLKLDGSGFVKLPFDGVGYPYTAAFDICLDGTQTDDAILFNCDECTIYLNYNGNGVCFESGRYIYAFGVHIPTDKWVEVKISSQSPHWVHDALNKTVLYIDGVEYVPTNINTPETKPSNISGTLDPSKSTVLGTEEMLAGVSGMVDNLTISNIYIDDFILESHTFSGKGTEEEPYRITSPFDLKAFSVFINADKLRDAHFVLTSDLNMYGASYVSASEFNGVLDGAGHVITNLTISEPDAANVGLIAFLNGGTVKNLGIEDSYITGSSRVGAIVGRTMNAEIINCWSTASVTGNSDVGGIAGMFNSSTLYNCYSRATVNAGSSSAGGLCGSMNTSLDTANPVRVDNVYSAATVTGAKYVGSIAGWDEGSSSKTPVYMTDVYYFGDINPSGNYANREATKLTKAQLTDGTLLASLCNNVQAEYVLWTQGNDSYPVLFFKADFDGDGILTVKDALAVLRSIVNREPIDERYGQTTALDVLRIFKMLTK